MYKTLLSGFKRTYNKKINYKTKEMIPLTKKEKKTHRKQRVGSICKKRFSTNGGNKKYFKVKDHCYYTGKYRGVTHNICNLSCS